MINKFNAKNLILTVVVLCGLLLAACGGEKISAEQAAFENLNNRERNDLLNSIMFTYLNQADGQSALSAVFGDDRLNQLALSRKSSEEVYSLIVQSITKLLAYKEGAGGDDYYWSSQFVSSVVQPYYSDLYEQVAGQLAADEERQKTAKPPLDLYPVMLREALCLPQDGQAVFSDYLTYLAANRDLAEKRWLSVQRQVAADDEIMVEINGWPITKAEMTMALDTAAIYSNGELLPQDTFNDIVLQKAVFALAEQLELLPEQAEIDEYLNNLLQSGFEEDNIISLVLQNAGLSAEDYLFTYEKISAYYMVVLNKLWQHYRQESKDQGQADADAYYYQQLRQWKKQVRAVFVNRDQERDYVIDLDAAFAKYD